MKERKITKKGIAEFQNQLLQEERSPATVECKSIRKVCRRLGNNKRNRYRIQKAFAEVLCRTERKFHACKHQQPVCISKLV